MKLKIMDSPAPTLGLAMTASCLFMWGHNWHMSTWASLGISLAVLIGAGLLLGLLVGALARASARSKWLTGLLGILVGWLLVEILMIFLDAPAGMLAAQLGLLKTRYLKIPLALAVFPAIYAARGFRPVNVFLLVWLLIFLARGLFNIYSDPAEEKIPEAGFSVALKKKPNIYLYSLESYHSPYAMRLLYDHDSGPMVEYLKGKNFMVYDRTLANSFYTLSSMYTTFAMRLFSNSMARGNLDVRQFVRQILGGSDENRLFKILKDNGYHLTLISMDGDIDFQVQGPNLDAIDLGPGLFSPIISLNPRKLNILTKIYIYFQSEGQFRGDRAARILQAVERGQKRGGPFMVVLHGGARHTSDAYNGRPEEFEAWKPEYLEHVAAGDAEIKEILEYLGDADPGALVILIGDHGSRCYQGVFNESIGTGDLTLFRRQLAERGVTLDEVVQSFFGVLLAIRLPGGERRDISRGLALNHVNLFRHIFTYLNDDPKILETREPALSLINKVILGRDNRPVLERAEAAQ